MALSLLQDSGLDSRRGPRDRALKDEGDASPESENNNHRHATSLSAFPGLPHPGLLLGLHATLAARPLYWPPPTAFPAAGPTPPKQRRRTPKPASPATPPDDLSPSPTGKAGGGGDKVFTCSVCQRSFGYKHVLQNHERTHTGEKPFECAQCHKRFTRDHHLKTHMRLHTGEKPYHCTHCERQFVQVANLRRHLRVHTGERPYACDMCPSRFSDSNQLKAHALIHRGEKPFECGVCGGRFRRRHHLAHHRCSGAGATRLSDCDVDADADDDDLLDQPKGHNNNGSLLETVVPPEQTEPEDLSMSATRAAAEEAILRHPKFRHRAHMS